MFDIGWSEMLLVAVIAIVVIGPKDLPAALRQAGKWMGAVRKMASDFQGQFNEAMKEAELDDLRKELQDLKQTAQGLTNPIHSARDEVRAAIEGKTAAAGVATAGPLTDVPDVAAAAQSTETALAEPASSEIPTPRPADLPVPPARETEAHFNQTTAVGEAIAAAGEPPAQPKRRRTKKAAAPAEDVASVETKP